MQGTRPATRLNELEEFSGVPAGGVHVPVAPRDKHGGNPQEDLHSLNILRYSPKYLEKLSEKGSEGDSAGGSGQHKAGQTGQTGFTAVHGAAPRALVGLFGQFQKVNSANFAITEF